MHEGSGHLQESDILRKDNSVFFDCQTAFDTVPNSRLITKLDVQATGREGLLEWTECYLTEGGRRRGAFPNRENIPLASISIALLTDILVQHSLVL